MNRKNYLAAFIAVAAICLCAIHPASAFDVKKGLGMPQSFIVDPQTGNYYISNIKGHISFRTNNGFITLLSPDGSIMELKLIEGGHNGVTLTAPKGILIVGDTLYVSDTRHVRTFDKKTGEKKDQIDLTSLKASFLNGITLGPDGRIFVCETRENLIISIRPDQGNKAEVFASGKELESPNGIIYDPKSEKFYVTLASGVVGTVDKEGKVQKLMKLPAKSLSGVDLDDEGNLYVSSLNKGVIYKIGQNLKPTVIAHGLDMPANISLDKNKKMILVPLFLKHKTTTINY
jgi:hypothetical protein